MPSSTKNTRKQHALVADWHPLQYRVLTLLFERPASPTELSPILGEPNVGNVAYHVRQLEKRGLVEEIGQRPGKRGSTEHFFKAVEGTALSGEDWEALTPEQRLEYSEWTLQLWGVDFGMAIHAGTLDADLERHLTRQLFNVDAQGYRDLKAAYMDLYDRGFEIQAESDQRRAESGEESQRVRGLLACFEMPGPED